MIPLSFAGIGEKNIIRRIGGKDDARRHLNNLGFVEGSEVEIVTEAAGNLIVNVKESRIAISKEMANRIVVEGVLDKKD